MIREPNDWPPGSFTKNFSWGKPSQGLRALYDVIRVGFNNQALDVPRDIFRDRVKTLGRPDFIATNFFLFNRPKSGVDHIIADELVFQAVNFSHTDRFDLLALFAFHLSLAGVWHGQQENQRRPAMWANHYIRDRVARQFNWETSSVSADDIELYLRNAPKYRAKTSRKVATNLYYLYKIGHLADVSAPGVQRWWVDAIFLALDRAVEDRKIDGLSVDADQLIDLLYSIDFLSLSGKATLDRKLALRHVVRLYEACGRIDRLSDDLVLKRTDRLLPHINAFLSNDPNPDPRPRGAIHASNPRILKSIPRACAMLAREMAGFYDLGPDELENLDLEEFIRRRTLEALEYIKDNNISPTMSAADLAKLTRER